MVDEPSVTVTDPPLFPELPVAVVLPDKDVPPVPAAFTVTVNVVDPAVHPSSETVLASNPPCPPCPP